MCVLSSHLFWTSSLWTYQTGSHRQEEDHTGFLHLPSALTLIFLARRIQPFLSLVDREVEFCVLTNYTSTIAGHYRDRLLMPPRQAKDETLRWVLGCIRDAVTLGLAPLDKMRDTISLGSLHDSGVLITRISCNEKASIDTCFVSMRSKGRRSHGYIVRRAYGVYYQIPYTGFQENDMDNLETLI